MRGPDKRPRKRKTLTPACYGSRKKRPVWATEANLRRVILGPALRYYQVVIAYYRQRKSYREISRETGIKRDSLASMTQRVRRFMGVHAEPKGEVVGTLPSWRRGEDWMNGRVKQIDQRGLRKTTIIPAMFSDEKLRACIMTVALERYELARQFWIENKTLTDLMKSTGLSKSTVGLRLWRTAHLMEHPSRQHRQPVSLSRTKSEDLS